MHRSADSPGVTKVATKGELAAAQKAAAKEKTAEAQARMLALQNATKERKQRVNELMKSARALAEQQHAEQRAARARAADTVTRMREEMEFNRRFREELGDKPKPTGQLNWQILPGGHLDQLMRGPGREHGDTQPTGDRPERIRFLDSLGPLAWYSGSHLGQRVYVVAVFADVAIADSPDWGNALYYCSSANGRWQGVFRHDKQQALAAGARRIFHADGWEDRVRRLVRTR